MNKKILLVSILVVTAISATYFYMHHNANKSAETTSKAETAQSGYTGGKQRESQSSSGASQGGAIDNKGQLPGGADTGTDNSTWTLSDDGAVTVKQPTVSGKLVSGSTLSGSSKLDTVQYRLIDDKVGVVAQGALSVVNGNFSGTLRFQPRSSTGSLEVFSYNTDGREVSRVEIPVKFE